METEPQPFERLSLADQHAVRLHLRMMIMLARTTSKGEARGRLPRVSALESLGEGVWRIRSISDLKNYDHEIQHFFDWLHPMVVGEPGQVIGHWLYEGDIDEPPTPVVLGP